MARMNPRRRRMAQQAKLLQSIVAQYGPAHDDSEKLQRGPVRNALDRVAASHKPILPREKSWESAGKAKRSTPKRWSGK